MSWFSMAKYTFSNSRDSVFSYYCITRCVRPGYVATIISLKFLSLSPPFSYHHSFQSTSYNGKKAPKSVRRRFLRWIESLYLHSVTRQRMLNR